MTRISVRVEGHYEVHESPFARAYEWHPAYMILECNCGEELALTAQRPVTTCRCGADHGDIIRDIQEREGRVRHEDTHPWRYDTQAQTEQHLQDEDAYP